MSVQINNDSDLAKAVLQVDELLQSIQDYCGRENRADAKVRFPRGFIRTASDQRERIPFVKDTDLKSNISYTLILSDVILWLLIRTDISATAKEMLIKLFIFLGGAMMESITKDYLKGICGKSYKHRTQFLLDKKIVSEQLKVELDWAWDTRNNMHLFMLEQREYVNDYNNASHSRCANAFKDLIGVLKTHGRIDS